MPEDTITALEQYYGSEQKGYNIILCPLLHPGGYGCSIKYNDGSEIYSVIGPLDTVGNSVGFGNSERFFALVWHEFGHSFVGPIVDKYNMGIDSSKALYYPIESKMKKQAYSSWITCFTEHLINSVAIRMLELNISKNAAVDAWKNDTRKGFIYLDRFLSSLRIYEQNRDKYKSLESFFPKIIESLKAVN